MSFRIRSNTVLEELRMALPQPQDKAKFQACSIPALLEALAFNHTIMRLHLRSRYAVESSDVNPWDSDFQQSIETILELKRARRAYLEKDDGPEKKADGVDLLAKVRYDLNCIYYRLSEHPGLCASKIWSRFEVQHRQSSHYNVSGMA